MRREQIQLVLNVRERDHRLDLRRVIAAEKDPAACLRQHDHVTVFRELEALAERGPQQHLTLLDFRLSWYGLGNPYVVPFADLKDRDKSTRRALADEAVTASAPRCDAALRLC